MKLIKDAQIMIQQGLNVDCLIAKKMQQDLNNAVNNNSNKEQVAELCKLRLQLKEIHQENIDKYYALQHKKQCELQDRAEKKEQQELDDPKIKINGCNYEILKSITKTHFKKLMRLTVNDKMDRKTRKKIKGYNWETKVGTVKEHTQDKLKELAILINKSNSKRAETSHLKALKKQKTHKSTNTVSSCEHEDLGSLGYTHGEVVKCPFCGKMAKAW